MVYSSETWNSSHWKEIYENHEVLFISSDKFIILRYLRSRMSIQYSNRVTYIIIIIIIIIYSIQSVIQWL